MSPRLPSPNWQDSVTLTLDRAVGGVYNGVSRVGEARQDRVEASVGSGQTLLHPN